MILTKVIFLPEYNYSNELLDLFVKYRILIGFNQLPKLCRKKLFFFFYLSRHCTFPNKINYFPVLVITSPRTCFVLLTLTFPQTVVTAPRATTRRPELEPGGGFSFLSGVVGVDVTRRRGSSDGPHPPRPAPKSRTVGCRLPWAPPRQRLTFSPR